MNYTSLLSCIISGGVGALLATALSFSILNTQADTKLLPFQGRLTDTSGSAIADGPKVVEFKMFDAPIGGKVKWAGEVHKLSVNGGLVNTMLGSKASLGNVDFSTPTYLQITVDAQAEGQPGNGQITEADPPLLPRQSVVPAIYAAVAGQMQYTIPTEAGPSILASRGWEAVFDNGRPDTGKIPGSKIATQSITGVQLKEGTVASRHIENGAITSEDLSPALAKQLDQATPPGTIIAYGGTLEPVPPEGWLACDGAIVSRAKYAKLFSKIGTAWGIGDGITTFHLPNLQGMFVRGVDGSRGMDPDKNERNAMSGGNAGNKVGSWQPDQLKSHAHDLRKATGDSGRYVADDDPLMRGSQFNHEHSDTRNSGAFGGNETRPVNAYVYYLIKQ